MPIIVCSVQRSAHDLCGFLAGWRSTKAMTVLAGRARTKPPRADRRLRAADDQPLGTMEAYATIVTGDGPHACFALVLGRVLRELDGTRRRAVLVHNVSAATLAMLTADGVWEPHWMHEPIIQCPQSVLWPNKSPLWAYQVPLWALPFRRVLYFDADHLPLLSVGVHSHRRTTPGIHSQRLRALWRHPVNVSSVGASIEGPPKQGCFNSGMMLLRPRLSTVVDLHREALELELGSSRLRPGSRLKLLRERCPLGWNGDQALLNSKFQSNFLRFGSKWTSESPYTVPGNARVCGASTATELARHADSYHFMDPMRPWQQLSKCALFGTSCTAHPIGDEARLRFPARASNCSVWGTVASLWWKVFLELPTQTRAACQVRLGL